MKKLSVLILLSFLLSNCKTSEKTNARLLTDPRTNTPMLVGLSSRDALQKEPFVAWFEKEYYSYVVDHDILDTLKDKNFTVTVVMATWCPDSRREVPRFYRIMDEIDFPDSSIKLYTVDRDKKAGKSKIKSLKIERVPTFIFYKNGKEIGRIVETPQESLEADMVKIINNSAE